MNIIEANGLASAPNPDNFERRCHGGGNWIEAT
jgi:hypothetical protein